MTLKCRAFELYTANLLQLAADRLAGQPPPERTVQRLCELRCLLECARPVETRVRHQIDRLVQLANAGSAGDDASGAVEPTAARLDNFQLSSDDEDEDSEAGNSAAKKKKKPSAAAAAAGKPGKYIPPKVTPMFYDEPSATKRRDGESTDADRRAKRRAIQLDVLEELRQQIDDAPLEVSERRGGGAGSLGAGRLREAEARRRYEEANMTRLSVSRRQRQLELRAKRLGGDFETLGSLLPAGLDEDRAGGRRGKKGPRGKLARKLAKRGMKKKKK